MVTSHLVSIVEPLCVQWSWGFIPDVMRFNDESPSLTVKTQNVATEA